MPLRTPTQTRAISKLGLSEGGSLAKGYDNFRTQLAAHALGEEATADQTRESIAQYGELPDEAKLRALNAIEALKGQKDTITDAQALRLAQGGGAAGRQQALGGGAAMLGLPGAVNRIPADNRAVQGAAAPRGYQRALPNGQDNRQGQGNRQAMVAGRGGNGVQNMAANARAVVLANGQIEPQWHAVRNLPGYLAEPIRATGRQALAAFTRTDVENIILNSTLSNAEDEVRSVMAHVAQHGTYIRQPEKELMTFAGLFDIADAEAYQAGVRLFQLGERDYLLVKDPYGHYIYSWPSQDRVMQTELQIEGPGDEPAPRGYLR
jgi:hypothetical protein